MGGTWWRGTPGESWGVSLLAVAALLSQLPKLQVDTSNEAFLKADSNARVVYDAFRAQFGRESGGVLAIRTPGRLLLRVPGASPRAAPRARGGAPAPRRGDEPGERPLHARRGGPAHRRRLPGGLARRPRKTWKCCAGARSPTPLYRDALVSSDSTLAILTARPDAYSSTDDLEDALAGFDDVGAADPEGEGQGPTPLTGPEMGAFIDTLREVVARHQHEDFQIHVTGQPVMNDRVLRGMIADIGLFTGLSLLVIGVALGWLFRSFSAVMLSLGTALLAAVCGFGVMAATGRPLSTPTQVTPSFLLAVGVGNSVHLLAIFFQSRARRLSVEDSVAYALSHSGLPIVLTGLTTRRQPDRLHGGPARADPGLRRGRAPWA